ncbi:MAG: IclR family transcriptional regulator [Peptococcaceae bacterium]|nr:IclR family transcriptional regulator [Peptococcaceae bacterium]MDH7525394.1 IclR family transcriptional regulator [Peptococcaceae bacterium]
MEYNDNKYLIQTLTKGLTVFDCFKSDMEEYGITELSSLVDMPESTVQRIINTLEFKGYIYQNPNTKKYRLALKLLKMDNSIKHMTLWIEKAKKHTTYLNEQCDETVNIAIRDEDQLVYVAKVETQHLLRPTFVVGARYPLYCTGLGKCLISDFPEDKLPYLFPYTLKKMTPNTKTDLQDIIKDLRKIKKEGYIIDDEEFQLGLYCVAAPIYGFQKVVAALSVTIPKVRVNTDNKDNLIQLVIGTAQNITNEFKQIFETPE